jgi:rhodanese-related sulfurtransferase
MIPMRRHVLSANLLAALILGCWMTRVEGGHGRDDDVDLITVEQVKRFLDAREKLTLVDLRPAADFKQKRLPGARSIPLTELKQRMSEIPRAGRVILYCDCRPADEAEAFYLLRDNGHRNVAVLQEGFSRWTSLNYPLEAGTR